MYIFDCEVFRYDWLFVFKEVETGIYTIFHNDSDGVRAFMSEDRVLAGFNNKTYDNYILKAVICGADNETVKDINDYIIGHENDGWTHPFIKEHKCFFESFDLMDDCQQGLSLKAIEAHLGIDIEESSVDFNIDRPLTEEELKNTIFYCKYDVDATEILFKLRQNYLQNKLMLGRIKGIDDTRALYMTNAKLTAAYLDAEKTQEYTDERNYRYPDNLLREYIPQEVFDFFDKLKDKRIPDEILFKSKFNLNIGRCVCTIAFGGIHGAIPTYRERASETRSIRNRDVGSYYPHLMTIDGYCSRNIPNAEHYAQMLEKRMAAKKSGDKATANALKLVANTTYGAMLNKYNDLFDPLMGRSVCITGQLRLLELANHLVAECPTLSVIQLNTDGIMVSLDNVDLETYNAICEEWQQRTGFELEEDSIKEIIQKDVNNYIEIAMDDSTKIKGGQLVRGIVTNTNLDLAAMGLKEWQQINGGAFNINNNAIIVAKALLDYFAKGIPIEDTINGCNDVLAFQIISKVSSKYTEAFQIVDGKKVPTQKCNRVYATTDTTYGTLYKVHAVKDNDNKVAGLPEHCIIDNRNLLTMESIDKQWYIRLAKRYVNDFLGIVIKKPNGRKAKAIEKRIIKILEDNKK